MKKFYWTIPVIFILAGVWACAHTGGLAKPATYSFMIDIPEGWHKIDDNRFLLLTKESSWLQLIVVQNRPIDKSFRFTKKKIQKGMLPEEAAQIIIDELVSDQNLVNLRVLANTPATIQGYEGFEILYIYNDSEGRANKTLYYGFIKEDTFFNLRFSAADQIYFQRDIGAFRRVLNSFQVVKAKAAQS